jgi:branched-chain amino acid transport system permease protein
MELFLQQLLNGLSLGSVYAIFAVGFSLIFATLGILNVAHGTFATWGALAALVVMQEVGGELGFALAAVAAVLVAGALGVLTDLVAFEPLRGRGTEFLGMIISSIGVWIILGTLAVMATNATPQPIPQDMLPEGLLTMGGLVLRPIDVITLISAISIAAAVYWLMYRTRTGAAIRAVGLNPSSATIVGVSARRSIALTSFLAAAIAGFAGLLAASASQVVDFHLGEPLLLKGFAAVVIGGFGSIPGAYLGGLFIGVSEILAGQYLGGVFQDGITYLFLIAILLFRPRGLFAEAQLKRA